jgi:hypothetical protein
MLGSAPRWEGDRRIVTRSRTPRSLRFMERSTRVRRAVHPLLACLPAGVSPTGVPGPWARGRARLLRGGRRGAEEGAHASAGVRVSLTRRSASDRGDAGRAHLVREADERRAVAPRRPEGSRCVAPPVVRPGASADGVEDAAVCARLVQGRMRDRRTCWSLGAVRFPFVRRANDLPPGGRPPARTAWATPCQGRTVAPTFDPGAGGATETW